MKNWFHIFSMAIVGAAIIVTLYVSYLLFWPYKTIDYHTYPLEVIVGEDGTLSRKDHIFVVVDYTKHADYPSTVTRQLECNENSIIQLSDEPKKLQVGRHKDIFNQTYLPEYTPDGICKIVFTIDWQVNPLRKIHRTVETEHFTVK